MNPKTALWRIDLALEKISALAESIEIACPLYVEDRDMKRTVSKIRALATLIVEQTDGLRVEIERVETP